MAPPVTGKDPNMAKAPSFSAFQVFHAMTLPGQFRPMGDDEFAIFADAPKETLIGSVPGHDEWLVLVTVGGDGNLAMEACQFDIEDGSYSFERGEWQAL